MSTITPTWIEPVFPTIDPAEIWDDEDDEEGDE